MNKTFCTIPWMNLSTETNGKCKICCVVMRDQYISKESGEAYEIQKDSIESIWNSSYLKDIRKKMIAGEQVEDCRYCYEQEEKGGVSPRLDYNERYFNQDVKERIEDSKKNQFNVSALPSSLELRPGTVCNLRCNTCWGLSSSRVYIERKKIVNDANIIVPEFLLNDFKREIEMVESSDFSWFDREIYLENLKKCIPYLKRIYFTGGEPTLIKSNIDLLEELVSKGKKDVRVCFTTNLTNFNAKLILLLQEFDRVEITGSIDSFGVENDYIRYPSEWKKVSQNLLLLNSLSSKIGLSIISVVQTANIFGLIDLCRWLDKNCKHKPIQIIPTLLESPSYLRLSLMPKQIKQKAIQYIESYADSDGFETNRKRFLALKSYLLNHSEIDQEGWNQFTQYIKILDQVRGTSFVQAFPQFKPYFV